MNAYFPWENRPPKKQPLRKIGITLYPKDLRKITGSVNAALLMSQLEYWFKRMKHKPFYKFKKRCEHPQYMEGDSWTEELGFSIDEFNAAFNKIGKRYKSKADFNKHHNSSNEQFYYSIYYRPWHLTYYFRNKEKIEKALLRIFGKPELPSSGK